MNKQQLPIRNPCTQDWDAMEGGARQRYCASCEQSVYNLSSMTRTEAQAVLDRRQKGQRLCVRYTAGDDGEILFQRASLLPAGLLLRTRQVALQASLAAAAMVAVVELPGCTPAGPATGAAIARAGAEQVVEKLAADGICSISLEPLLPLSLNLHAAACQTPTPPTAAFVGQLPALAEPQPERPPIAPATNPPPSESSPTQTPAPTPESHRTSSRQHRAAKQAAKAKPPVERMTLMGDIAAD